MGAALLRIRPRADVYDVGRRGRVSSVCETLLGVFGAVAPVVVGGMLRFVPGGFTLIAAVVCALATAGMVVAVFSPIRTIPASADWERSEV
nr:hypothetical protein [Bifidobacterium bifidum]